MAPWTDGLLDLYRQQSLISDVMVGLDEGSQRSGETLNIRAIPTTATIQDYSGTWAEALREVAEIFLMLSWGAPRGREQGGPQRDQSRGLRSPDSISNLRRCCPKSIRPSLRNRYPWSAQAWDPGNWPSPGWAMCPTWTMS